MPKVRFGSVVGTDLEIVNAAHAEHQGMKSTGIRSMAFIRKTQTKMVIAKRRDQRALAVVGILDLLIDEGHQHFDEGLHLARAL
jgi:hypothetical protein